METAKVWLQCYSQVFLYVDTCMWRKMRLHVESIDAALYFIVATISYLRKLVGVNFKFYIVGDAGS